MFTLVRDFDPRSIRGDLVAGVTVAAIAIPESLGYANIAGLPVQTGLYCALLPPLLFALIASSRQLVVGADSATAALVAAGAGTIAAAGSAQYVGAVGVLVILTAVILLAMALLRLGFLADLISQPVLTGFLSGVGVSLVIGKLPGVLGIEASGTTWDKLVDTVTNLDQINWASALLGFGVVAVMIGALKIPPQIPAALFGAVAFSIVGALIGAEDRGVKMIGALPPGLPSFEIPDVAAGDVARLAGTALAIAVVVLAQSAAVARSFGTKNGYKVDINADLVGLAAANAGSAVTGGFAINGSPPRTAAGDGAGSASQLVNVVMAVVIGAILVFAAGLFAYVPSPVLDGVVLGIGIHLIKVGELKAIARTRRTEFGTAMLALLVVAFVGVEQGVIIAVIVAIIDRATRAMEIPDEVLVYDGTLGDRAKERLSGVSPGRFDGVLVYRFGSALFFANATKFDERVRGLVASAKTPVTTVVIDAGAVGDVDFTGAGVLRKLGTDLQAKGVRLFVTDLSDAAHAAMTRSGLDDVVTVLPHYEDVFAQVAPPARS